MALISAFLPVYNEEKRIRFALNSLSWCDEVIVLDKSSTDKTVEIAKSYGAIVYSVENTEAYSSSEFSFLEKCHGDWIIIFTASDIVDVQLGLEIRKQAMLLSQDYSAIRVPFQNYVLGINGKWSPWFKEDRIGVFRRNCYTYKNEVHTALQYDFNKVYSIHESFGYLSHLTHVSVDMMMERHLRYWRGEAKYYNEKSLRGAFRSILCEIKRVIFRGSFFHGKDFLALSFAYLSYAMMSYVYKWEKLYSKAETFYADMREQNFNEWNECKDK